MRKETFVRCVVVSGLTLLATAISRADNNADVAQRNQANQEALQDRALQLAAEKPSGVNVQMDGRVVYLLAYETRNHLTQAKAKLGDPKAAAAELRLLAAYLELQGSGMQFSNSKANPQNNGQNGQDQNQQQQNQQQDQQQRQQQQAGFQQAVEQVRQLADRLSKGEGVGEDQARPALAQVSLALAKTSANLADSALKDDRSTDAGFALAAAACNLRQGMEWSNQQPQAAANYLIDNTQRVAEGLLGNPLKSDNQNQQPGQAQPAAAQQSPSEPANPKALAEQARSLIPALNQQITETQQAAEKAAKPEGGKS